MTGLLRFSMEKVFGSKNEKEPPPLLDEPWRKTSYNFSEEGCSKLKASLDKTDDVQHILLLGPTGAGKSSFVNSINSMSLGTIVNPAYVGKGSHSVSTEHGVHKDVGKFKSFVLHDTMGVESGDGQGFFTEDVNAMIRGEMPEFYKFNPRDAFSSLLFNYGFLSSERKGSLYHFLVRRNQIRECRQDKNITENV